MRRILVVLVLGACLHPRPLAPGETQCTTTHAFGVDQTHCQTGQVEPPIEPPAPSESQIEQQQAARPVQVTAPPAEARKVVEGDHVLICALHRAGDATGACFVSQKECDELRAGGSADDFTVCEERRAGACFMANVVLTKERKAICAPSITDCERRLAKYKTDADFDVKATQCGIYRTRGDE